jgi:hypothetical protein
MFRAIHKLGADPLAPVCIVDRKLPRLRNVPGKSDKHASDHLATAIHSNQMDLIVFIAHILF